MTEAAHPPWRLVLASESPRRAEILRRCGATFDVVAPRIEESLAGASKPSSPRAWAMQLALRKADAIALELRREAGVGAAGLYAEDAPGGIAGAIDGPTPLVLAADTIVVFGNRMLNKPRDADEARLMLGELAGETHEVVSALCVRNAYSNEAWVHSETTEVTFRPLTREQIDAYVATGSPLDKAGAYGIQDHSDDFPLVARVTGDYWNVVGLPLQLVVEALAHFGASDLLPRPLPASPLGNA